MQRYLQFIIFGCFVSFVHQVYGQGMHFSQYYNAPMLLSPANTALMPESDYRIGVNYRNQWSTVPVPFHTMAAYGDFQMFRNTAETNWLGIGFGLFNDRAGNGNLSLLKGQLTAAYHLQIGDYNMISVGLGAAFVQRSVDFGRLTFDTQWDGFTFNSRTANGERYSFQKTTYADVTAGINYAFFPNEDVYVKFGVGLLHINQPTESFYRMDNRLGMRPTANLDMLFKLNEKWIANVSGYYTQQKNASEMVYGAQFTSNVAADNAVASLLIFGVYHRLGDAIIPLVGFEWNKVRTTATVDVTVSEMSAAARGRGAMEFSIIYTGLYGGGRSVNRNAYNCPRF